MWCSEVEERQAEARGALTGSPTWLNPAMSRTIVSPCLLLGYWDTHTRTHTDDGHVQDRWENI